MQTVKEHSAGGAVFKRENNQVLWLVQERAGAGYWQLPKGHVELGESVGQAALREVQEESGITARIIANLSPTEYFYTFEGQHRAKTVDWFLMEYVSGTTDDYQKSEVDQAAFLPFAEALERVEYDTEKQVLQEAKELIPKI